MGGEVVFTAITSTTTLYRVVATIWMIIGSTL